MVTMLHLNPYQDREGLGDYFMCPVFGSPFGHPSKSVHLPAVRHSWLMSSCGSGQTPAPVYTTDLQPVTPYLLFTQSIFFCLCLIVLLLIYIALSSAYYRLSLWL